MPATNHVIPLNIALLTVSDTRTRSEDSSGQYLEEQVIAAGHNLSERAICIDDIYQIRAKLSQWIAAPEIHAVITTGGTGFSGRDSTPEAISPLFDKDIEGFGELFRHISYTEIGTSTVHVKLAGQVF